MVACVGGGLLSVASVTFFKNRCKSGRLLKWFIQKAEHGHSLICLLIIATRIICYLTLNAGYVAMLSQHHTVVCPTKKKYCFCFTLVELYRGTHVVLAGDTTVSCCIICY